jgi:hypothetical protein
MSHASAQNVRLQRGRAHRLRVRALESGLGGILFSLAVGATLLAAALSGPPW